LIRKGIEKAVEKQFEKAKPTDDQSVGFVKVSGSIDQAEPQSLA